MKANIHGARGGRGSGGDEMSEEVSSSIGCGDGGGGERSAKGTRNDKDGGGGGGECELGD